jgi:hypothetical protein
MWEPPFQVCALTGEAGKNPHKNPTKSQQNPELKNFDFKNIIEND